MQNNNCGRIWPFWREGGVWWQKSMINFFVGNEILNIFSYNNLKTKKTKKTFSKITAKNNFLEGAGGTNDHFLRNGASDDKNEYNLFYEKWGTEYGFAIFTSKNPIPAEWKPKNHFWRHIFPHISCSIGQIVSKKIGFTHLWPHTNHVNLMKIGSKLQPVSWQ